MDLILPLARGREGKRLVWNTPNVLDTCQLFLTTIHTVSVLLCEQTGEIRSPCSVELPFWKVETKKINQ